MRTWFLRGFIAGALSLGCIASASAQSFPYTFDSQASDNSTPVVAGYSQLRFIFSVNTTTTLYWLKLYDKATAPTCGTDTVKFKAAVPFGASNAGGGFVVPVPDGLVFEKGVGMCITANQANSDDTNAATGLAINLGIKQ